MSARRRLLLLLFGSLVLVGLGTAVTFWLRREPPPPVPTWPKEGLDAEVGAMLQDAAADVRRDPRDGEAWGRLGLLLRAHGFLNQSNDCFRQAARLKPRDSRWPYLIAVDATSRDPDNALPPLRTAVSLGHEETSYRRAARLRLAEVLLARREVSEAEQIFREELEETPSDTRARYGLALAALARDDPGEAIRLLRGVAIGPFTRKKVAVQLALAYRLLGDTAAAERQQQEAAAAPEDLLWPDPYVAECNRLERGRPNQFARVSDLEGQGKLPDAEAVLREMAQSYPDERTYVALGINLAKQRRFPAATQILREVLKLDADHVQARYFLAVSLFFEAEALGESGEPGKARPLYRESAEQGARAASLKPDHALARVFRGRALARLGETQEALASLRAARESRPDLYDTHYYLGDVLASLGRWQDAVRPLEDAARLAGDRDPTIQKRLDEARRKAAEKKHP